MSWNEAPRSKLVGITELKPSEMPEIFGGASASAAGHWAFVVTVFEQVESAGVEEPPWLPRMPA